MSRGKSKVGIDLTEGPVFKKLVLFILPVLLTNVVQQFYNIVDVMIIGQFAGSTGTVGVSTGGEIVNFLTFVSMGFSSAVQIYISQLWGAKKKKEINETIGTALTFLGLMSICFMILSIVFCRPLLEMLNTPEEAMEASYWYMLVTAFGLPFIFEYNAVCGILRGMGESKHTLEFVTISAVMNIFLDLLFVAVFQMGAMGTAIATVIAQFGAMMASFIYMYRNRDTFDFDFKLRSYSMKKEHLTVLVKLGIPMAASSSFIHISQLYCNARINSYGLVTSAVNSIGNKVVRFANIMTSSINTGCSAAVGQNLGARKIDRVRTVVKDSLAMASVMAGINVLLCIFAPTIYFIPFSRDPEVIEAGVSFMHISIITFVLSAWQGPFNGVVNGSGNARLSFIVGMLDGVVLRIGISVFLVDYMHFGVEGFYYGNALARLAPCIICTVYYFKGSWKERKLLGEK